MFRKLSILLVLLFCEATSASCVGMPLHDIGIFEILSNKKATVACEGKVNGFLKFAGCVLEVRDKSKSTTVNVYSTQKEICDFKPNQVVEMYVNTACCGQTVDKIICSDFPNGDYGESPFNDAYGSCDASNARYIHLYRREVDGKSVIRFYNEGKKAFEDSKLTEISDKVLLKAGQKKSKAGK